VYRGCLEGSTVVDEGVWVVWRVVKGLKLSREELGQELLPEVRGWGFPFCRYGRCLGCGRCCIAWGWWVIDKRSLGFGGDKGGKLV
jgi:hypothetical protein